MRLLIWCPLRQSWGMEAKCIGYQRMQALGSHLPWLCLCSIVLGNRTSIGLRLISYMKCRDYNTNFFVSYKLGSLKLLKYLKYPEFSLAHNGYLLLVLSSRESRKSQMEPSLGSTPPTKKIKILTVTSQAKNKGVELLCWIWEHIKFQDPVLKCSLPAKLPPFLSSAVLCVSLQEAPCLGGAGLRELNGHWVQTKDETHRCGR